MSVGSEDPLTPHEAQVLSLAGGIRRERRKPDRSSTIPKKAPLIRNDSLQTDLVVDEGNDDNTMTLGDTQKKSKKKKNGEIQKINDSPLVDVHIDEEESMAL